MYVAILHSMLVNAGRRVLQQVKSLSATTTQTVQGVPGGTWYIYQLVETGRTLGFASSTVHRWQRKHQSHLGLHIFSRVVRS